MTGPEFMTTAEVAHMLRLAPKTLRNWRHTGGGPRAVKLAAGRGGAVRYRRTDVDAWARQHLESRTREQGAGVVTAGGTL